MSRCNRYEREGLLAIERGQLAEDLAEHLGRCDDCRDAEARYLAVTDAIAASAATLAPRPDFEARVFAAIARRRPAAPARWRRAVAAAGLLSAAGLALALFWLVGDPQPRSSGPAFEQSIERGAGAGGRAMRGDAAGPGDRVRLRIAAGRPAALRVYRAGAGLVYHCGQDPPCARDGAHFTATFVLDVRGDYQAIAALGGDGVAPMTGDLAADLAALERSGAEVLRAPPVLVR